MAYSLARDWELEYALRRIAKDYGDRVSIEDKLKTLLKFGFNPDVDTSYETVWLQGGDETYLTTNGITSVSSDDNGDTSTITIEGHTVSGTDLDQQFTFVSQTIALTGQTDATLATPLARASRLYVADGEGAFAGALYVHEGGATTAGVPNDAATIHLKALAADQQSQKAASTISNIDYYIVTQLYAGVSQKTAGVAQMQWQTRAPGGAFRTRTIFSAAQGGTFLSLRPYFVVPKNHDFRFRTIGSTANLEIDAFCNGYLGSVT